MSANLQAQQRHPVIELFARYAAVLQAAWAVRHELAGPKRLADEAAFLPAALSLQDTPARRQQQYCAEIQKSTCTSAVYRLFHVM